MSAASIAVVDDDPEMLELMSLVLGKAGYKVQGYPTPGRFFDGVLRSKPALCIVDVHLPGMDGREIIRVLRANPETTRVPVIAVSAAAKSSGDVVRGMDNGADEYLLKPLDLELLVARVENLLGRRGELGAPEPERIRWGDIEVMPEAHSVTMGRKAVPLTHLEFKLLEAFLRQPDRVLARSWLLQTVWGASPGVGSRTVDKHVEALRKKLPGFGRKVETVVGVGYLFRAGLADRT